MADKTTGGLEAVQEAAIGSLPGIADLYDETLIPVEQQGEARHMTGAQWKRYAQAGVSKYVEDAQNAANDAQKAVAAVGDAVEDAASSARAAETARAEAEEAREAIENMEAAADTLTAGQPASVTKTVENGIVRLLFGLPKGQKGTKGDAGSSVQSIERTAGTGAAGTVDTYTITMTDGTTHDFQVYNGADGKGSGDMLKSIYDTENRNTDVFKYVDEKMADVPTPEDIVTMPAGGSMTPPDVLGDGPFVIEFDEESDEPIQIDGLPVNAEILETVCEEVRLDDNNPSYTLPALITLDTESLYFLSYQYFDKDGQANPVNSGYRFSKVDGEFVRWLTADENNSVTLTSTGIADTWRASACSSIISIYRVKIAVKDGLQFASLNYEGDFTVASGQVSHAEGSNTVASGLRAHAEGQGTIASGINSHAEGSRAVASGINSHAEGGAYSDMEGCTAIGYGAHAEGISTIARGTYSHAEGDRPVAEGPSSHAEGRLTVASGTASHAEGFRTTASGYGSHAEGTETIASADYAHAEGTHTVASGSYSHAEGSQSQALGLASHAEGINGIAASRCSHVEGQACLSGYNGHAGGNYTVATYKNTFLRISTYETSDNKTFICTAFDIDQSTETLNKLVANETVYVLNRSNAKWVTATVLSVDVSQLQVTIEVSETIGVPLFIVTKESGTVASGAFATGDSNAALSSGAFVTGADSIAYGVCSVAMGESLIAQAHYQTVIGAYNAASYRRFIVGNGSTENARSNAFSVDGLGAYVTGQYFTTGADYAEMFEWADGNPNGQDRIGLFVTLDGEKIRIATDTDTFILGVTSGNPSVVGDTHDDQWHDMYLYDIYGRPIFEDVLVPEEVRTEVDPDNPEKTIAYVIQEEHTERRHKVNPDYDHTKPYVPRSQRPEWSAVGLLGKLVVIDDGSCQVNGWAKVSSEGTATHSDEQTCYRVMSRLDQNHIRILIMQGGHYGSIH